MFYKRSLKKRLKDKFFKGKSIVLIGPRQVGKTHLINTLLKELKGQNDYLFFNGDDPLVREQLNEPNTAEISQIIGKHKIIFIDEVQRINNIGLTAKIITDQFKDVQLIMSGSSALEINKNISEPLTGRKWEYMLYPISWSEIKDKGNFLQAQKELENILIYGSYPDVLNNRGNEQEVLRNLVSSYLYKDLLTIDGLRKTEVIDKLLLALALQMGHEVSYNELSSSIGVSKNTIASYIDLLEKAFVIYKLPALCRNLRNEIKRNKKIYFYDNGVRNTIINNYNRIELRQDKGALWENFLLAERKKYLAYQGIFPRQYFWRNKSKQEVDYVEEIDGKFTAFEFKWQLKRKYRPPASFEKAYKNTIEVIDNKNYTSFIDYTA